MVRQVEPDPSRGVYGISVAASLVGNAPQNLRLYEARGLVAPARSDGGTRLYSEVDLERLREISELLENGLNLAGVYMVLGLQEENERLQNELDDRVALEGERSESRNTRSIEPLLRPAREHPAAPSLGAGGKKMRMRQRR